MRQGAWTEPGKVTVTSDICTVDMQLKVGSSCSPLQKPIGSGWWDGKCFILDAGLWQEDRCLSKGQLPPLTIDQARAFIDREGVTCRNSPVLPDSHLEIGQQWLGLTSVILVLGAVNRPRFHFFLLFEAKRQEHLQILQPKNQGRHLQRNLGPSITIKVSYPISCCALRGKATFVNPQKQKRLPLKTIHFKDH